MWNRIGRILSTILVAGLTVKEPIRFFGSLVVDT